MKESEEALQALKSSFSYDPETGLFTCINPLARRHFGKVAGTKRKDGYIRLGVKVSGKLKMFLAHRVAWAFYHGVWPDGLIDHKDWDRQNNKIDNLRVVDKSTNNYYSPWKGKSQTGYRGVRIDKRRNPPRYQAIFGDTHLGMFSTAEEAYACYQKYVMKTQEIIADAEI